MAKWKQLKEIANNVAAQFATSCEHFDSMMNDHDVREVRIDLLTETVEPDLFDIDRNMNLIHRCAQTLKQLVESQYGQPVEKAVLLITGKQINLTIRTADGREIVGSP